MATTRRKTVKKTRKMIHDELYAEIPKLSFNEARRIKWNIYDALTQELYEEGCIRSAGLLKVLATRERGLLERNTIRESLSDYHELLIAIYENMKYAERSETVGDCGQLTSMKLWYQNLLLIERQGIKFDWILKMFYDYLMPQVAALQKDVIIFEEIRVRIIYKYAMYLSNKGEDVKVAVQQLSEALDLCRGQIWTPDESSDVGLAESTMHDAVAIGLATVCLQYAREHMAANAEHALELTHRGIVALAEVGMEKNKVLVTKAYLTKIEILLYSQKFEAAFKQIRGIYNFVMKDVRSEFIELKCDVYKYLGICSFHLLEIDRAIQMMHQCLMMCCKYKLTARQGDILLEIGRLYSKLPNERQNAKGALRAAKRIFCDLNDHINEKKVDYMLAKQNADHIFPSLLNLMKSHDYCKFYALRQWKNRCTPFWQDDVGDNVEFFAEQLWSGDMPSDVLDIFDEPVREVQVLFTSAAEDTSCGAEEWVGEEAVVEECEPEEPKLSEPKPSEYSVTTSMRRDTKMSILDTMDITPPNELVADSDTAAEPKDNLSCLINEFAEEDELRKSKMADPYQMLQDDRKQRNTELYD